MIDLILKGGYNYVSAVHTEGNNLNQGCLMSHVLFQSNSNFLSSINLPIVIENRLENQADKHLAMLCIHYHNVANNVSFTVIRVLRSLWRKKQNPHEK